MICRLLALQLALGFGLAVGLWYALTEEDRLRRRHARAQQPIDLSGILEGVDLSVAPAEFEATMARIGARDAQITVRGRSGPWPYVTIGEDSIN